MNRSHPDWSPTIDPDAVCAQTDPEAFFPDDGQHVSAQARRVCLRCPIREACREWALNQGNDLYGVWGALSKSQRNQVNRERRAATEEREDVA